MSSDHILPQEEAAILRKEMANMEISMKETIHTTINETIKLSIKQSQDEIKQFIMDIMINQSMQQQTLHNGSEKVPQRSTFAEDHDMESDDSHAQTMHQSVGPHSKSSSREKPLSSPEDYAAAIYNFPRAKPYVVGTTNFADAKSMALQQELCITPAPDIQVTEEDLAIPFDKPRFIATMKEELEGIKEHNVLDYCKLSKEINTFHRFPPKEALHVVLNIIITAPAIADKIIFIPSALRTLMLAAIGGINPDNPDHLATIMNCMQSFDETLHVYQFFDLLTTADQLLTKFFKTHLGWNNNPELNSCGDIKTMFQCLHKLAYVHLHPAFNVQFNDTKKDNKILYSDSIDNLGAHLNAECFMKYSVPPGPIKTKGVYQDLRSKNIFQGTTAELKAKHQSVNLNVDPLMKKLTREYNHLAKIVAQLYDQRDYLALTNVTWLVKDFGRDPKFRKETLNVIKKFSSVLEKEHQLLPLEKLKQIIREEIKSDEFKPSVDLSLMRQTLVDNMMSFDSQSKIYFNDSPLTSQLNKATKTNPLCNHCQCFHTDISTCIPNDGDFVAWNNFTITRAFLDDRMDPRNTADILQTVFRKIITSQQEALSNIQQQKSSKQKKQQKFKKKI